MPKADWKAIQGNKNYIQHREKSNTTIAIYGDGCLLFVDNEPVGELMKDPLEAIKHYDENYNN